MHVSARAFATLGHDRKREVLLTVQLHAYDLMV